VQPWWSFPVERVDGSVSLLGRLAEVSAPVWLLLGLSAAVGTALPFVLFVGALRHLSPTKTVLVGSLEPVFGAVIAFAWLSETLSAQQAAGGLLVVCAVIWVQAQRPTLAEEAAPAYSSRPRRVAQTASTLPR
jgi:drug/metabolite transporter (DMT)-like permease